MIDHTSAIAKAGLGEPSPMWVAGEWTLADDVLPCFDPTTGAQLATIGNARNIEVDRAVQCARDALKGPWSTWAPRKRAAAINKLATMCENHIKDLARIEMLDAGIPRMFANKMSAKALVRNLQYYASWADKLPGQVVGAGAKGWQITLREPVGVVASIFPWNVPLLFVGSKLGPALAAGNTVILKPSELASLSTLRVARLIEDAGFPPGVVQVLTGDGETGRLLVSHPGIDLISFTGGRTTARKVQASAAETLKPVIFELGGKSPNIVFPDANMNKATMMSTFGVFGLTGQACAAGSRVLAHKDIADKLAAGISQFARSLGIGDPLDPATMVGPLISARQLSNVRTAISTAKTEGATESFAAEVPDKVADAGHFIGPHIFTGVTPEMHVWKEEVFGPVLAITTFESEEEALSLANQTEYGLAAGVWTQDVGRVQRMTSGIDAGIIWVNTYGQLPVDLPFGGFKQSGWGKEGGGDALVAYTRIKSVVMEG